MPLKRAGWKVNHIEGSHFILTKEGSDVHLSVRVRKMHQPSGIEPKLQEILLNPFVF